MKCADCGTPERDESDRDFGRDICMIVPQCTEPTCRRYLPEAWVRVVVLTCSERYLLKRNQRVMVDHREDGSWQWAIRADLSFVREWHMGSTRADAMSAAEFADAERQSRTRTFVIGTGFAPTAADGKHMTGLVSDAARRRMN